ncbi:MAG: hypothetical protein AAFN92_23010, partial [Bacteroidota bacterium]
PSLCNDPDNDGEIVFAPIKFSDAFSISFGTSSFTIGSQDGLARVRVFRRTRTLVNIVDTVGGLRTAAVSQFDRDGTSLQTKKYRYVDFSDTSQMSGVLYNEPSFGRIVTTPFYYDSGEDQYDYFAYYTKFLFSDQDPIPLTDNDGYHIGYRNVEEYQDNGASTKTTYKTRDIAADLGSNVLAYPYVPIPNSYLNGRRDTVEQMNATNVVSSSVTDGSVWKRTDVDDYDVVRSLVLAGGGTSNGFEGIFQSIFSYTTEAGHYQVHQETTTQDGVVTTTDFTYYNNQTQPNKIEFTNSEGEITTQYRYFAADVNFLTETIPQEILGDNMQAQPIEQYTQTDL